MLLCSLFFYFFFQSRKFIKLKLRRGFTSIKGIAEKAITMEWLSLEILFRVSRLLCWFPRCEAVAWWEYLDDAVRLCLIDYLGGGFFCVWQKDVRQDGGTWVLFMIRYSFIVIVQYLWGVCREAMKLASSLLTFSRLNSDSMERYKKLYNDCPPV